jgi:hypothetical protein
MQTNPVFIKLVHHLRPTRGGAAAVVVVFALLLFLADIAGWMGIPLALLLASWFFKYAYILFDHTVRGFDEPPTLDIQMMNPIDEQRPLAQLGILGLLYGAVKLLQGYWGSAATIAAAVVLAFFLPASVATPW